MTLHSSQGQVTVLNSRQRPAPRLLPASYMDAGIFSHTGYTNLMNRGML